MTVPTAVYNFLIDFLVCFPLLCYERRSPALLKESLDLAWAWGGVPGQRFSIPGSLSVARKQLWLWVFQHWLFPRPEDPGLSQLSCPLCMGSSPQVWSLVSAVLPTEASWSGNPLPYRQQTCIIALFRHRAGHPASSACWCRRKVLCQQLPTTLTWRQARGLRKVTLLLVLCCRWLGQGSWTELPWSDLLWGRSCYFRKLILPLDAGSGVENNVEGAR